MKNTGPGRKKMKEVEVIYLNENLIYSNIFTPVPRMTVLSNLLLMHWSTEKFTDGKNVWASVHLIILTY